MKGKRISRKLVIILICAAVGASAVFAAVFRNNKLREAITDPDFSTKKLLVRLVDGQSVDADAAVLSSYEDVYLLQYDSEEKAKKAYEYYQEAAEFVDTDGNIYLNKNHKTPDDSDALKNISRKEEKSSIDRIAMISTGSGGNVQQMSVLDAYKESGDATLLTGLVTQQNPGAKILSVQAFDKNGVATSASVYAGIESAVNEGAGIIVLPFSTTDLPGTQAVESAISDATKKGITVIGAAGDENIEALFTNPGVSDNSLIVGACDSEGQKNRKSNYGQSVDYNVVGNNTNEAAATMAGYVSRNGVSVDNKTVFPTDRSEKVEPSKEDTVASMLDLDVSVIDSGSTSTFEADNITSDVSEPVKAAAKKYAGIDADTEVSIPSSVEGKDFTMTGSRTGSNAIGLALTGEEGIGSGETTATVTKVEKNGENSSVTFHFESDTPKGIAEGDYTFKTREVKGDVSVTISAETKDEPETRKAEEGTSYGPLTEDVESAAEKADPANQSESTSAAESASSRNASVPESTETISSASSAESESESSSVSAGTETPAESERTEEKTESVEAEPGETDLEEADTESEKTVSVPETPAASEEQRMEDLASLGITENDEGNLISGSDIETTRILVKDPDESAIQKDADHIVSQYDDIYLLEYASEEEAKDAYETYQDQAEAVENDAAVISIADGSADEPETPVSSSDPLGTLSDKNVSDESGENLIAMIDTGASVSDNVVEAVSVIDDDPSDGHGHGTRMAGFIAAENPDAEILSIKAFDENGRGTPSSVYAAIEYARKRGVKIINLSASGLKSEENSILGEEIEAAISDGITVIGAAGNNNIDAKYTIPGYLDNAVIAGAVTKDGMKQGMSNFGSTVDYYVASDSTSAAAAKLSGILSKDGEIQVDGKKVFASYDIAALDTSDGADGSSELTIADDDIPHQSIPDYDYGESVTATYYNGGTRTVWYEHDYRNGIGGGDSIRYIRKNGQVTPMFCFEKGTHITGYNGKTLTIINPVGLVADEKYGNPDVTVTRDLMKRFALLRDYAYATTSGLRDHYAYAQCLSWSLLSSPLCNVAPSGLSESAWNRYKAKAWAYVQSKIDDIELVSVYAVFPSNSRSQQLILNASVRESSGRAYVQKSSSSNAYTDGDPYYWLGGAVYKIYDENGNVVANLTTEVDGSTDAVRLKKGTYYAVEVATSPGFKFDDGQDSNKGPSTLRHKITVSAGHTATFTSKEIPYKHGQIILYKKDQVSGQAIEGAEFTLYERNPDGGWDLVGTLEKASNAPTYYTRVLHETYNNNKHGAEFRIVETKAPVGHIANFDKTFTLTDNINQVVVYEDVPNLNEKVKVSIVKYCEVHKNEKETVSGATMHLYTWDKNQKKFIKIDNDDITFNLTETSPGTYEGTFRSDATNEGKFRILEDGVPPKYSGKIDQQHFINSASLDTEYSYVGYNHEEPQHATVALKKTDRATGKALSGATFKVYEHDKKTDKWNYYSTLVWNDASEQYELPEGTELIGYHDGSDEAYSYYGHYNNGEFLITEEKAPDGYETEHPEDGFDPGTGIKYKYWNVTKDGADWVPKTDDPKTQVVMDTISADNQPTSFYIQKTDSDGNPMNGVVYRYGRSDVDIATYKTAVTSTQMVDTDGDGVADTTKDGVIVLTSDQHNADDSRYSLFNAGTWQFQETDVSNAQAYDKDNQGTKIGDPGGYALDETWHSIYINKDGLVSGEVDGTYTNHASFSYKNYTEYPLYVTKYAEAEVGTDGGTVKIRPTKDGYETEDGTEVTDASVLELLNGTYTDDDGTRRWVGDARKFPIGTKFSIYEWSEAAGRYSASPIGSLSWSEELGMFAEEMSVDSDTADDKVFLLDYTPDNQGRFEMRETASTPGFILDTHTEEITIPSKPDPDKNNRLVEKSFTNKTNHFILHKTDTKGNQLKGAEFRIWKDGYEGDAIFLTTNDEGVIERRAFTPGTWHYQETSPGSNKYANDPVTYTFIVSADGTIEGSLEKSVVFVNTRQSLLRIQKLSNIYLNNFPAGTEFYIFEWDSTINDYSKTPSKKVIYKPKH